jgi:HEAT repeat protein
MKELFWTALDGLASLGLGPGSRADRAWNRRRRGCWRDAARRAGLSDVRDRWGPSLSGRAGELAVLLDPYPLRDGRGTRIVVTGPLPERLALMLLDTETRRLADALAEAGWLAHLHEDGRLEVQVTAKDVPERIAEALDVTLELARRLRGSDELPARLARTVRADPLGDLRLRSLQALLETFPRSPHARDAASAALQDPRAEVRLHAALVLGSEGRAVLEELACSERTPDEAAARALREVGRGLAVPRLVELLGRARRAPKLATVGACIESLGRAGDPGAAAALAPLLDSGNEEQAAAAARALAEVGGPAAESPLLARVATATASPLVVEVVRALGRVGSAAAVPLLRRAGERLEDGEVSRAALQAIAEIQSRLTDAAPGQLSLSSADAGQVSLAGGHDAGRLSIPDEP